MRGHIAFPRDIVHDNILFKANEEYELKTKKGGVLVEGIFFEWFQINSLNFIWLRIFPDKPISKTQG